MKHLLLTFSLLLIVFAGTAAEIQLETTVKHVTIYHSGALVKRTSDLNFKPGLHELTLKDISSKLVLNSLKIGNKEATILNKTLIKKLTKEEFNSLTDKKEALEKQQALIEAKYQEVGFVSEVEDLEKMTAFYLEKTLSIKKQLRAIEAKIDSANALEQIELNNENAAILKLLVSIEKGINEPLKLQYVCGGIGWSPSYDIDVKNASETSLDLKYMARIMSQTGENWENISVSLSSSFPLESPTALPVTETPWVLKRGSMNLDNENLNNPGPSYEKQAQIDQLEGVEYQNINIPYFLSLRELTGVFDIKSNSTVFTFPILSATLPANYFYYGFPSLNPQTFLVSEITGWNSLELVDGVANITFNGNDVGRTILKFSESEEVLLLPIARDNSVFLERSEIADQNYSKESNSGKRKKSTMAFEFIVKNNNSFPIKFELVDQIPISQSKSAEVETLEISDGSINLETGEVTWLFDLAASQSVNKELAFSIETDSNFSYSDKRYKSARFRTISCPSF